MRVQFFTRTVAIMAGGRKYGEMERFSLPGDRPEAWDVRLDDRDGILDPQERRRGFISRADAEAWALPRVQRLVEHAERARMRADEAHLAEIRLGV